MGGRKSPFPITLAIGLYNSLYYRTTLKFIDYNVAMTFILIIIIIITSRDLSVSEQNCELPKQNNMKLYYSGHKIKHPPYG